MAVYECCCEFTAGTATAFHNHLTRSNGDGREHRLVSTSLQALRHRYNTRQNSSELTPALTAYVAPGGDAGPSASIEPQKDDPTMGVFSQPKRNGPSPTPVQVPEEATAALNSSPSKQKQSGLFRNLLGSKSPTPQSDSLRQKSTEVISALAPFPKPSAEPAVCARPTGKRQATSAGGLNEAKAAADSKRAATSAGGVPEEPTGLSLDYWGSSGSSPADSPTRRPANGDLSKLRTGSVLVTNAPTWGVADASHLRAASAMADMAELARIRAAADASSRPPYSMTPWSGFTSAENSPTPSPMPVRAHAAGAGMRHHSPTPSQHSGRSMGEGWERVSHMDDADGWDSEVAAAGMEPIDADIYLDATRLHRPMPARSPELHAAGARDVAWPPPPIIGTDVGPRSLRAASQPLAALRPTPAQMDRTPSAPQLALTRPAPGWPVNPPAVDAGSLLLGGLSMLRNSTTLVNLALGYGYSYLTGAQFAAPNQTGQPARHDRAWAEGGIYEDEQVQAAASSPHLPIVERLQDLVMWRDPGATTKALAASLYIVFCCRSLPMGLTYLQPMTVLCSGMLAYLLWNLARPRVFNTPRHVSAEERHRSDLVAEANITNSITSLLTNTAQVLSPYVASVVVLARRRLLARSAPDALWSFLGLWGVLLVSEARIFPQSLVWLAALAVVFTLPWAYEQSGRAMDGFVADTVQAAVIALSAGNRHSLSAAGVVALAVFYFLELSLVIRTSLALVAGFYMLRWQVNIQHQRQAEAEAVAGAVVRSGSSFSGPVAMPAGVPQRAG